VGTGWGLGPPQKRIQWMDDQDQSPLTPAACHVTSADQQDSTPRPQMSRRALRIS